MNRQSWIISALGFVLVGVAASASGGDRASTEMAKLTLKDCIARQVTMHDGQTQRQMKKFCKQQLQGIEPTSAPTRGARAATPEQLRDYEKPVIPTPTAMPAPPTAPNPQ